MKYSARMLKTVAVSCLCGICLCFCLTDPAAGKREASGEASKRISDRDKRLEREKRFFLRSLEDLRFLLSLVETEQNELNREIDAIPLLELPNRETDLGEIRELFDSYADWVKEYEAEFDTDLAMLSSSSGSSAPDGQWPGRYAAMSTEFRKLANRLSAMSERFDAEGKRLAAIIDRRRLLRGKYSALEEQIANITRKPAERGGDTRNNNDTVHLRARLRVVQNELSALSMVTEDTLKHYFCIGERVRAEAAWMATKSDEYEFLGNTAATITGTQARNRPAVEAAISRLRRANEQMINRMKKRIDTIDRKLSLVSPAGTLQEMQRSNELHDLYLNQKQRYEQYIDRLKIQTGALEADLGELFDR
jgi:hypothetical protein